jgi:heme A synthase
MSHWPFRVTMTVAAALLFDQAIFAGRMLSGSFPALHTHRENATYAGLAVLLAAICAIPIRWPGRGPLWPAVAGLGLFALIGLQILLGFARVLVVHVPLGVSIIVLGVLLTIWAWRYQPAKAPAQAVVAG